MPSRIARRPSLLSVSKKTTAASRARMRTVSVEGIVTIGRGGVRASGSLARSLGEGEGEGQLCGADVCCGAHSVVSRGSGRRGSGIQATTSTSASLHLDRNVFGESRATLRRHKGRIIGALM
jgi:hypothetical protein